MILVTVGTNEQPFDRLVRSAAQLRGEERLVVQYGSSRLPHGRGEWVDFLPFEDLMAHALEARVVVCHAGVGSIMLARRCGRRPVVVARRRHLGEAVDDHQVSLAARLSEAGLVTTMDEESSLEQAIAAPAPAPSHAGPHPFAGPEALGADVRVVLASLGARPLGAPAPVSERAA